MSEFQDENHRLKGNDIPTGTASGMISCSVAMIELRNLAARFAANSNAPILITGESGTGKEVLARFIHQHSPRCEHPFVSVNCAALSESLIESELFGHERNAFTGANDQRIGRFELAKDGTLLLDEISEISIGLQAKLLRVLENAEFQRVGGNESYKMDARIIATSNRPLHEEIRDGNFRADLFYRLHVLHLELPPLRERPDDIVALAEFFLQEFRQEASCEIQGFDEQTWDKLRSYAWPGNIRQLRNVVRRMCVLATSPELNVEDSKELMHSEEKPVPSLFDMPLKDVERELIFYSLNRFKGNKTAAANHLGVTTRTLHNKLRDYKKTA